MVSVLISRNRTLQLKRLMGESMLVRMELPNFQIRGNWTISRGAWVSLMALKGGLNLRGSTKRRAALASRLPDAGRL